MSSANALVDAIVSDCLKQIETTLNIESRVDDKMSAIIATLRTDTTGIRAVVDDYLKDKTLKIVVEDRRKSPTQVTEITQPTHSALPDLLGVINAGCWSCLVGPTGSGKTLGVLQTARILGISNVCIKQMTRIIAPHDLIGYMDAGGHYRKGAWTDAILGYVYDNSNGGSIPVNCIPSPAIIIVDEMDNSNENVVMIIKGLQTGLITMPYGIQQVNPQLIVVATMNTWGLGATREYIGRQAQDAALLNEFQFIEWNYDKEFEAGLLAQLYATYETPGEYKLEHFSALHQVFLEMRRKAETTGTRAIISTRNILNTAKLLVCNPKWSVTKALTMTVYKGLKPDEIKRIECPEVWTLHKPQDKKRKPHLGTEPLGPLPVIGEDRTECPI